MIRTTTIRTLAATLLAFATPLSAQQAAEVAAATEPAPEPAPASPAYRTQQVALATGAGTIVLELETGRAPETVANFLRYVDEGRFNGASFYRAMRFPDRDDLGLLQGGTEGDPKRVLPPVAHEPTTATGLSHDNGAISMARAAPGTATGDFFIILGNLGSLDADPEKDGDNLGYAVFGHVTGGMDVVRKILAEPVSDSKGEGTMRGQMLERPVPIISAVRIGD